MDVLVPIAQKRMGHRLDYYKALNFKTQTSGLSLADQVTVSKDEDQEK
ncbi:hypothetical protein ACX3YG_10185 [Pseudomonas wadenswilerensis]